MGRKGKEGLGTKRKWKEGKEREGGGKEGKGDERSGKERKEREGCGAHHYIKS